MTLSEFKKLKIGDSVIVTRIATRKDWTGYWASEMDKLVKKKVRVTKFYLQQGYCNIDSNGDYWSVPYQVLKFPKKIIG